MSIDFGLIFARMPEILAAFWVTVWIWVVSNVLAVLLGFGVATLRRYGPLWLDLLLRLLVEIIRGTPFLVQLFLLYFGGPFIGDREVDGMTVARSDPGRASRHDGLFHRLLQRDLSRRL